MGCLQIALHVSTTPTEPLPEFLHGLLAASWPLAVAAVLFVLLDVRMHQNSAIRVVENDEPEIPEAPIRAKSHPAEPVSYFNVEPAPVQVPSSPAPSPAPEAFVQSGSTLFATPPPFRQVPSGQSAAASATVPLQRVAPAARGNEPAPAQSQAPMPPNQGKPQDDGLSFFKL